MTYLDNAATSFPKPRAVTDAVSGFMLRCGGNPGRGSHKLSLAAARTVYDCRCALSELFDAEGPEQVAFVLNTTMALNTAIKGLLKKGDHVLISDLEHNAVYRPVHALAERGMIEYDVFPSMVGSGSRSATKICAGIGRLMRKNTKMIICTAASNICSATMPLQKIGDFCRRHSLYFVVDGAQAAGHMPLSVREMHISALCLPGHKGLLGPQGCGAIIFGDGIFADTLIEGGNGIASLEPHMWAEAPERYEAGTLPVPAIAGLLQGVEAVRSIGIEQIFDHECTLFDYGCERLGNIEGVELILPRYRGAVLLMNMKGIGSEELSQRLSEEDVCTRGGYHCSALGHKALGTEETGGLRISFGAFNSSRDIDALYRALKDI